jgi:glutaryl-CoA dehydrogenase
MLSGMLAVELARVDPSVSVFFGVHNGLAGDSIYDGGNRSSATGSCPR